MSAPAPAAVPDMPALQRTALRAERDLIEHRQYADMLRLREIRAELAQLPSDEEERW